MIDDTRYWQGIYNSNTYPVNVPSGATPCSSGDNHVTLVTADHLIAFDSEYVYTDGSGSFHASVGTSGVMHVDLKGSGWGDASGPLAPNGTHNPIGLGVAAFVPNFAGAIRPGEMKTGILHMLAVVSSGRFKNRNTPGGTGQVWPATMHDGNFNDGLGGDNPYGTTGNIYMGSILSILPGQSLSAIGLVTPEALAIATAIKQYGLCIIETGESGGDLGIKIDNLAFSDIPGFPGYTGSSTHANFINDLSRLGSYLQVVTNHFNPTNDGIPRSGSKIDGGDGTPQAPTAIPFK